MKVFAYIRVSSKGQVEGDGPERQRQAIRAFCTLTGLELVGEFSEEGVSGTVEAMDRPAFVDMLECVSNRAGHPDHCVSAIVVERMDRLARDLMVCELLLAEARKRGLAVYCVDQGVLIDVASSEADPTRILIRQIMGALAQWEKSMLVRKLKVARERKKLLTGRCEGRLPYGAHPGEEIVLEYVRALVLNNRRKFSLKYISEQLNYAGFKTRKGTPWTKSSVCDLRKRIFRERNNSRLAV